MRTAFARCYDNGLEADPTAEGNLLIALQVGKDGSVTRADSTPSGKVPAPIDDCIKTRAKSALFAPPAQGSAIVSFSVTLTRVQPSTSGTGSDAVTASPDGYADSEKIAAFVRNNARECYKKTLRIKPTAEGRLSVRLGVEADGKIASAEAVSTGNLPDELADCVEKRSKPAQFAKPASTPASVTVPVALSLKRPK
jgi:hypothetical protein